MINLYRYEDTARVANVLKALVPESVEVNTSRLRDGLQIRISMCGKNACHTFEFGPGVTDHHLVSLAECWKTGDYVEPVSRQDLSFAALQAKPIDSAEQLIAWARSAAHGQRIVYFKGELAQFRYDAPREIAKANAMLDQITSENDPDVRRLRFKVRDYHERLEVLQAIETLREASVIQLVQLRLSDGTGSVYYAIKS